MFSADLYDAFYAWKDYPAEVARLQELVQERCPEAQTVLDVACGTGKHLELLRGSFEVEGVDVDPRALSVARGRLPGVPLHRVDMVDFDLGRRFDVVVCLFSSIGFMRTVDRLQRAVASMARHRKPDGVLVVEPWLFPDVFEPGRLDTHVVDEPELKAIRIARTHGTRSTSILDFHYLAGTPDGVESFEERHELGLFSHEQYLEAFRASGLEASYDAEGLMGRGLYVG